MLSYLMVIMRPKKLKNGLQTDAQIKTWLTWSKKKSSKGNTVYCQCWSPTYKISLLSPTWQGCHQKDLTVTCSRNTKQILIIAKIIRISTSLTFTCQCQFSFLLDKKKNQPKLFTKFSFESSWIRSIPILGRYFFD